MSFKLRVSQVGVNVLSRSALIHFQARCRWLLSISLSGVSFSWTFLVFFSDVETGAVSVELPSAACLKRNQYHKAKRRVVFDGGRSFTSRFF